MSAQDIEIIKEKVIRLDERMNHLSDAVNENTTSITANTDTLEGIQTTLTAIDERTKNGLFGNLSNKDLIKIIVGAGSVITALTKLIEVIAGII